VFGRCSLHVFDNCQWTFPFSINGHREVNPQSLPVVRRAQILGGLSRTRMSLAHYEIIVDAGSSDVCVENDVDALTRRQPSALVTVESCWIHEQAS
jgi:hypothetical protein